ncbi:DERLIN-1 [Artemisia annua]|uniref:Derlin n=1 Tax=Artemisia annua TaxID=35608 RepID=A0A2U1MUG0_ARTAN|nr:DERLIN-1 [Artemisia annua]
MVIVYNDFGGNAFKIHVLCLFEIFNYLSRWAFYLPWAMLAMDVIFGSPIGPDLCGILAGHLYYFFTVLHPLAGGKVMLQTPMWLRKVVAKYRIGAPTNTQTQATRNTGGAFSGRSYRVGG